MAFYIDDIPVDDIVIEPAEDGRQHSLDRFDEATAELRTADGEPVEVEFYAYIEEQTVVVEWPDTTPFETAGIYTLLVTLTSSTGPQRERLRPVYLVAQDDGDGWHTVDSARTIWTDAPDDDARLFQLLTMARMQCEAFGFTALGDKAEGQIMHCRNIWNAGKVDPASGGFGEDSFVIRPFPLDWMVKQVLRPKVGLPTAVG